MKKLVLVFSLLLVAGINYVGSTLGFKEDTQNKDLAREGGKMYSQMCAACHGEMGLGEGGFSGTALHNQQFLSSVSDKDLFNYIKFGRIGAYMPE